MSTLRVSNIADTAGSNISTPSAIANGICKAWVNFNGTGTVAIRASFNVSSITDNGVGNYAVNFATALSDANYCVVVAASASPGGGTSSTVITGEYVAARTSSSIRVQYLLSGGTTYTDVEFYNTAVFR